MSEQRPDYLAIRVQQTGQVFTLGRRPLTIGRQPGNTIVLPDSLASRQHARIEWQPEGPVIYDLGSTHGTYVNGRRVSGSRLLQPGHVLRIGNTILEVETAEQPVRIPAAVPQPARPRGRSKAPGWLLIAGVAFGLVAALALLLAAGGLFVSDSDEAGTVLPGTGQDANPGSPTPLPTASLVEVATSLPAASASPAPPTAQPTAAPATAGPPTAAPPTAAPPPTNTPVPEYPAPSLVSPTEDQAREVRGQVTFSWSYPRALSDGEGFQVLIWKEGQPHNGAAGLTRETQQTIDLDVVLPGRGGGGDYFWTVVVRRDAPGEALLSPEANPRRLVYAPQESGPPLPNECASFDCERCFSWDTENPLCTQCECF